MIDVSAAIRTFLAYDGALVALVGTRLWAETDVPAAGYKPSDGGALCFKVRGGLPDFSAALYTPSVQFKAYGATALAANAVYRALFTALQDTRKGGIVRWAQCEALGQTYFEPATTSSTPWPVVLCYFSIYVANTE